MKKLMIAAAVAMVAIASQAAVTFNWQTTSALADGQPSPGFAANLPVYLFASGTDGSGTTITRAALLSALEGKTYASVADAWNTLGYGPANMKTGADAIVTQSATASDVTRGAQSGDTMKFFFVAQNAKGDLFFSREANRAVQDSVTTTPTFGPDEVTYPSMAYIEAADLANASKGGWITMAGPGPIPEPTSGLLLLLGVAGLALRRKHV